MRRLRLRYGSVCVCVCVLQCIGLVSNTKVQDMAEVAMKTHIPDKTHCETCLVRLLLQHHTCPPPPPPHTHTHTLCTWIVQSPYTSTPVHRYTGTCLTVCVLRLRGGYLPAGEARRGPSGGEGLSGEQWRS